jgi:pyruvate dehydrogenase (quinone)
MSQTVAELLVNALKRIGVRHIFGLIGDSLNPLADAVRRTAVHHKLPVKAVVYNNSAFGLITLEAESIGLPAYREGIEFPNPDYVALANACGGQGFRAARPGDLRAAIGQALAADGPAIIDCVVASNEIPNFPHLELDKVGNYAVAKIKEAMLAFCGR